MTLAYAARSSLFIALAFALLPACTAEPSSEDITQAMNKNVGEAFGAANAAAGGLGKVEMHGVKKLGCEKTDQARKRLRMVKGDDGWTAVPTT